MNDATLPPHCPSSIAGATDVPSSSSSSSGGSAEKEFPFPVHSQDAVNNGQPPEVNSEKLPRQKRRRTSPEDQTTLEAEYKHNPKPDKIARQEIVKRVALGEKEVQIWFQNRRQNTRRKSRPLLPHEIAAFGLGGMAALSSDPLSSSGIYSGGSQSGSQEDQPRVESSQPHFDSSLNREDTDSAGIYEQRRASSTTELPVSEQSEQSLSDKDVNATKDTISAETITLPTPTTSISKALETPNPDTGISSSQEPIQPIPSSLGYLANRRNAMNNTFSTPSSLQHPLFETPLNHGSVFPSSAPERLGHAETYTPSSSSKVRLSLSLDGKAELTEISPPRILLPRPSFSGDSNVPRRRMGGLQRSQSALPFTSMSHKLSQPSPLPKMPSGRSRNARTWELLCDTEARDELTTQAENESSGSAVAALNLLRSTSGSALKSNQNKRNATVRPETNGPGKRAKLGRAISSLARLQSSGNMLLKPQGGGMKGSMLLKSPSGDSDKENWSPHENAGNSRRRLASSIDAPKQSRKRVLQDNNSIPTLAGNLGTNKSRNRKRKSQEDGPDVYEDPDSVDPVVERFMSGSISPSKKGDLDCVQGLLSLSQGNWR